MDGRDTASECRARSGAEHACFKFTETITTSVPSLRKYQLTLELNPRIDSAREGPSAKAAKLFQALIEELQELKAAVVEVREEARRRKRRGRRSRLGWRKSMGALVRSIQIHSSTILLEDPRRTGQRFQSAQTS